MGKKKFNLCSKCNFRHASPTGKGCLAGDGEQALDKPIEDEIIQGGQASSRVGLDGRCDSSNRRKAGSSHERMEKIEQDMTARKAGFDHCEHEKPTMDVSEEEEVVGAWTRDIADAWSEVKDRGRQKHKPAKPLKPRSRRQKSASSSDSSSSDSLEAKGETKRFAQKKFFPKDFKVKRSEEIVHACVKTVDKVLNEGGDPSHAMRHLKFVSEKVSKACFNFEAVAGYDQAVRERVELEGYSQFSIIETEEVFTHFSVENTVKKVEKSSKKGKYKPANGAKTSGICFRFNSEEGCTGKCYFIHKCSECDSKSHGKIDCKKASK